MLLKNLEHASSFIKEQLKIEQNEQQIAKVGIVLGSGLTSLVDLLLINNKKKYHTILSLILV